MKILIPILIITALCMGITTSYPPISTVTILQNLPSTVVTSNYNSSVSLTGVNNTGTLTNVGAITTNGTVKINNTVTAISLTDGTATLTGGNLSGAGTLTAATLSGTLSTASQPNITNLGTLTILTVNGTITNTGTLTTNGLSSSGTSTLAALQVNGFTQLGAGTNKSDTTLAPIVQFADIGEIAGSGTAEFDNLYNAYYSGGYKRKNGTSSVGRLSFANGATYLNVASSGAADSAVTWVGGVTVLSNGNVGVNNSLPNTALEVIGTVSGNNVYSQGLMQTGGNIGVMSGTNYKHLVDNAGSAIVELSGGRYGWTSNASNANNSVDTCLSRTAASTVAVGNGTAGDFSGTLQAGTVSGNNIIAGGAVTTGTGTVALNGVGVTSANATTACVLTPTSGPNGANTAVQGWIKFVVNGVVRFVPYW